MIQHTLIILTLIFMVGSGCQWLAWRVKLPAIIFLLLSGILAGPVLGLLDPDQLLGELLAHFVSLSVAAILFEGSLTLRYKEILGKQRVVRNLVTFGLLVTCLITAVVTHYTLSLSWQISFMFGAVSAVTGPTVIAPMLRTVRPTAAVSNILRWEGIVVDPIGASLAVLIYEFIVSGGGGQAIGQTLLSFCQLVGIGVLMGTAGGYLFGLLLRNHLIPNFLQSFISLGLVFFFYTISYMLHTGAGLLTVTVMGVWLANMKDVDVKEILNFKESLSIVLISLLFILLAARIDPIAFINLGWKAFLVFLVIQFLARPLSVMVSTLGSELSWPERHLLSWIAPRGIVAAAVSAIFAIRLENAGFADAHLLVPLTFFLIICTVLLQSVTARPIALWLGVAEPDLDGFLIIGASPVARVVGKALSDQGFRVLLTDSSWTNITAAKLEGLNTYYGNPISVHAENHLDLAGIGRMLALSAHENMNISSMMHFRQELGTNAVFIIQSKVALNTKDERTTASILRDRTLFGWDVTYGKLAGMLSRGAEIKTIRLTETYNYQDFIQTHQNETILLFALDDKKRLHMVVDGKPLAPKPGWLLICLLNGPQFSPTKVKDSAELL
ncbi:sodium:proton antiporter [Desulforhopalus sp. IMCC35007]|uniref:cation:proton antiporter n=1 Tax=Desulforhopalus sp. IMCC35007 TaxID=2569543 RepID=UPI0010AE62B6|nr:sodium:proton antiporter [Desulforhopalus sp. IMCC35007]TKB09724.1 sodium:proton antiporter [Desulforhopalus sp. IMCC35007]